jgi:hypothetical protein
MQHADETLLSVVVLELGAAWPPWLAEYQQHAPNSVVIAQSSDECGKDFARRIGRRMDEIGLREAAIHAGLIVSNGALDPESVAARRSICSTLLRLMLKKQHGELVLASDLSSGDDVRHELFALAGGLCEEVRGTQVTVRVRFDTIRPSSASSGVRKSAAPTSNSDVTESSGRRASNGSR